MFDQALIDSLAYLNKVNDLIESKKSVLFDPDTITNVLNIDYKDINSLLASQSKLAAYSFHYSMQAAKMNSLAFAYEETIYNKAFAHYRFYASLFCEACERKETISAINDSCIMLFTKSNLETQKINYCKSCYDQSVKKAKGKKEFEDYSKTEDYIREAKEFFTQMYSIDNYEELIEQKAKVDLYKEQCKSYAESVKQCFFAANNVVKLKLGNPEEGSIGMVQNKFRGS